MAVNTEKAVAWFEARQGKVRYSMNSRLGPNSYDCSSAVYFALRSGGAIDIGYAVSTETEHDWLLKNGYKLHSLNKNWTMKRGDVIIWGIKGQSANEGGHTMLALNDKDVIHCTSAVNGITKNNYDQLYGWNAGGLGGPYVYVYRQGGSTSGSNNSVGSTIVPPKTGTLETMAGETMLGKYGSGEARKKALGKHYNAVQTIINERLKVINSKTSHNRLADEVLKGKLSTGDERKKLLGTYYKSVQDIVNKR